MARLDGGYGARAEKKSSPTRTYTGEIRLNQQYVRLDML